MLWFLLSYNFKKCVKFPSRTFAHGRKITGNESCTREVGMAAAINLLTYLMWSNIMQNVKRNIVSSQDMLSTRPIIQMLWILRNFAHSMF